MHSQFAHKYRNISIQRLAYTLSLVRLTDDKEIDARDKIEPNLP